MKIFLQIIWNDLSLANRGATCHTKRVNNAIHRNYLHTRRGHNEQYNLDWHGCPYQKLHFMRLHPANPVSVLWIAGTSRVCADPRNPVGKKIRLGQHRLGGSCGLQRIFCPNCAVWKMRNISSIPAFPILLFGSKSLSESPCPIMRCWLRCVEFDFECT